MMSGIGVSCMGWQVIDYKDKASVINLFEKASRLAYCIEIPFIPLKWVSEIKEKVNQGKINIYSMHLPKHLVNESYETQQQIALITRYMVKVLNIQQLVVHPWNEVVEPEVIENLMCALKLTNTHIAFEMTNLKFMKQIHNYEIGIQAGLAIDISHLMRLSNETMDLLKTYTFSHVHLRGYSSQERYARIATSIDTVKRFIEILKAYSYPGKIILEYPYSCYEAVEEDLEILKRIQGEKHEILL